MTEDRSTGSPPGPAPTELRYLILAAQREGNRAFARLLEPTGLTPSQAEILVVLGELGPLSLRALGTMIVCEAGSPSRVVDALVRRGLVERRTDPSDRRAVLLDLTQTARELEPTLHAIERQIDSTTSDRLDAAQRTLLADVLRELLHGTREGLALDRRFEPWRSTPPGESTSMSGTS
ncbi:MarR family winged helix-turn-helix transcriptional regulator [Cellulomonas sp. URHE0023]|uniref:MarR family winged helix-turn-helix transcriptional regulator n=1 Tax=Cellulomonas sp. URHE0023 TaxID=1380354 RepID=UPI00068FEE8C|nr:MarR family transcriptional regulator [Cellulomonas sp. URHE0023]